jgi:hypothetical protein
MTGDRSEVDLDKMMLDPESVFATPEEVRDHPALTKEQKIEILRRWAYEASELAVAEEEGMAKDEAIGLARILGVLNELTGGFDVEHTPPTKQDGF